MSTSSLSEYSDENMMDPYNLAICFGPTLIPIPPDRDQVSFQTNVNEVIKTIMISVFMQVETSSLELAESFGDIRDNFW